MKLVYRAYVEFVFADGTKGGVLNSTHPYLKTAKRQMADNLKRLERKSHTVSHSEIIIEVKED